MLGVRNKSLRFRTADTVSCSFPYTVALSRVKLLQPDQLPYACPLAATRCTTYQSPVALLCVAQPTNHPLPCSALCNLAAWRDRTLSPALVPSAAVCCRLCFLLRGGGGGVFAAPLPLCQFAETLTPCSWQGTQCSPSSCTRKCRVVPFPALTKPLA